ncbi:MAG: ribose 5-phosphate isomerase B [Clostridia bacterium]|nr:ribose 5-phosphate isomerase B [Clostridia bacterium]MBQ8419884.1 ribose 5-phosphate isomerase B [Clostridia bacterium]
MSKIIAIASDHAGPDYKKRLIEYLTAKGYTCLNMGTDTEDSVDYPIYAHKVCEKILSGEAEFGILICGTGIGMSIAANKHAGIRAGLCADPESAALTRQHNNANVLCMGARTLSFEKVVEITDAFLGAEFLGGRHQRRVDMLENL